MRALMSLAFAALACVALPDLNRLAHAQASASKVMGEYFVTENADPICVPFTRNLNQFRRVDFDACHPRLSEKYPQFTRPMWEEIPFELPLAETIFKSPPTTPPSPVTEHWWQVWLRVSEPLRAAGKLKMWRTRVDIDGDGGPETIVRLDHLLAPNTEPNEQDAKIQSDACPYRESKLYMVASSFELPAIRFSTDPNMMKNAFNLRGSVVTDIIHFSGGRAYPGQTNRYYGVEGRINLPSLDGQRIGATRGLKIYQLFNMGAGEVCQIDWVPTGRYRPLRPR
jgi:hypothetical protein